MLLTDELFSNSNTVQILAQDISRMGFLLATQEYYRKLLALPAEHTSSLVQAGFVRGIPILPDEKVREIESDFLMHCNAYRELTGINMSTQFGVKVTLDDETDDDDDDDRDNDNLLIGGEIVTDDNDDEIVNDDDEIVNDDDEIVNDEIDDEEIIMDDDEIENTQKILTITEMIIEVMNRDNNRNEYITIRTIRNGKNKLKTEYTVEDITMVVHLLRDKGVIREETLNGVVKYKYLGNT